MCSLRSVQIKLVDLGSCQKVSKLGNKVKKCGHPEYTCKYIFYYKMYGKFLMVLLSTYTVVR